MEINKSLIKQALIAKMSNLRQSTSHTKTRGQVSGGGKKPWKQKGTGRARAGSSRSPVWVGGGVTFGPSNERNFKLNLPKKMAIRAKEQMWQLLKDESRIQSVEALSLKEHKTKLAIKLMSDLKLSSQKTLFITEKLQPELILACANIPGVEVMTFEHVGILDLARFKQFVLEKSCFDKVYLKKVAKEVKKADAIKVEKTVKAPAKVVSKKAATKTVKKETK